MRWFSVLRLVVLAALASPLAARDNGTDELSSIGAPEMNELIDALYVAYAKRHPDVRNSAIWRHSSGNLAIGALMFETADMAPVVREFTPGELAPYDHQFRGDMMKAPAMVPVALRDGRPVWIAVNRRPGAPLASDVFGFLEFVLSNEGQLVAGQIPGFSGLPAASLQSERANLSFFVARIDAATPAYRTTARLSGEIDSVGSDGMKSLMDRWMDDFTKLYPQVRRGERWEHLGTLNGFHALLHGLTGLAPMGRELWPQEQAAYQSATGVARPFELRVARGGFNTPQRTTAQAIFVHESNPLHEISVPQLRAIFAETFSIVRWGQLGVTGAWAERPIRSYMPPIASPNAMSVQISVLGGQAWNRDARPGSITEIARALANDPDGIGFGGFEEGGPGLKSLAVSAGDGRAAVTATYETASDGRYPLTRYLYIRLTRHPGTKLAPQLREFLRFILSRQGQEAIVASGYFPLTEAELHQERAKLD